MIYTKEKLDQLKRRWLTTRGKRLLRTVKNSRCYLNPVTFREKVRNLPGINDHELEGCVDLRGADLCGFDFRTAVQENDDGFSEKIAILSNIHFEGATLKHCDFQEGKIHDCFFENANLEHSDFKNASINNSSFVDADCIGVDLHSAKLINCNFFGATIKDITLGATIVDQKTSFGKELRSEKEGNFHAASMEYKQIKEMYKNSSLNGIADFYHYREMVAKRKIIKITNPTRWVSYVFGDLLCRYGTSFVRVFIASILIVSVFAYIFSSTESLLFLNKEVSASFIDSLYFSISTFTTLGYGDFHAIGLARFVAGFESFVGMTLISLFTVIVARNVIRD
ncbi:MAG: pentapeptide repeat-containing protein [Candidatus Paceibacterota bacterium]